MIKHILLDGCEIKDITNHVVNNEKLHKYIERIKENEEKEERTS